MKRLILIQIITLLIALVSGIGCVVLGTFRGSGRFEDYYVEHSRIPVAGNLDSGFDGGAMGLGLISAACFLCFVWIEITLFKAKK